MSPFRLFQRKKNNGSTKQVNSYGVGNGTPLIIEENPDIEKILNESPPRVVQNSDYLKRADNEEKKMALLIAYLQHPKIEVKKATIEYLTQGKTTYFSRVAQVLIDLFSHPDNDFRNYLADAIWTLEKDVNCEFAVNKLKDEIQYPGRILGRTNAQRALDHLSRQSPDKKSKEKLLKHIKNN